MFSYTCFGHKISSSYCLKRPQKSRAMYKKLLQNFRNHHSLKKLLDPRDQRVDPYEHEGSNHCMRLCEILNTLKEDIMNFSCARFVRMESKHLAKLLMKKNSHSTTIFFADIARLSLQRTVIMAKN